MEHCAIEVRAMLYQIHPGLAVSIAQPGFKILTNRVIAQEVDRGFRPGFGTLDGLIVSQRGR
jgi:hypothetical protein